MRILAMGLVLSFVGMMGCADGRIWWNDPKKREWSLIEIQKVYTDYVRFGAFEKASRYVDPEMVEAYMQSFPRPDLLRFTDYQASPVIFEDDEQREVATSTVIYNAYRTDTLVITTIVEKQEWYRVDKWNTWMVRPKFQGLQNLASNGGSH